MKHSLEGGMAEKWINKINNNFDVDKVLEEIKTSTYSKATCVGCKFLINLGRYMMNNGKSDDEILNLVSTVCSLLKIQKERVCAGTMDSIGVSFCLLFYFFTKLMLSSKICIIF